jgi:threonine synthase
MEYYSTNGKTANVTLKEAVVKGLAADRGLFMPKTIPTLPDVFFKNIGNLSLQEISYAVAYTLFGEDIETEQLKDIVYDTLNFDIPLVHVADDRYSLELFHGPTLAFKDVGARFMARLLGYFNKQEKGLVNVLVATSGDTGSAVANGFLGVEGVRVFVLYPQGKVSKIQESQFTTLGKNITAIEVNGTFDDCQALVKSAFMDEELNEKMRLTSANSINVARFLPQMFYYFHAYAQLVQRGQDVSNLVMAVPSGNFGNITAGLIGKAMGLPIKRFIAANNANDIFYKYLQTGKYEPKPSITTIANAMDVGDPSNFARVLDLYKHSHEAICKDISGCTYTDEQIAETMAETYKNEGYMLDPHGACGYRALKEGHEARRSGSVH